MMVVVVVVSVTKTAPEVHGHPRLVSADFCAHERHILSWKVKAGDMSWCPFPKLNHLTLITLDLIGTF